VRVPEVEPTPDPDPGPEPADALPELGARLPTAGDRRARGRNDTEDDLF
jgi:hypothetical protein